MTIRIPIVVRQWLLSAAVAGLSRGQALDLLHQAQVDAPRVRLDRYRASRAEETPST